MFQALRSTAERISQRKYEKNTRKEYFSCNETGNSGINRVKGGKRMEPMDEIYKQYASFVYKFLLSKVHDSDIAEEVTQETFYQAIRTVHKYDGSCSVSTWLCSIAKNQLAAYWRKHPQTEDVEETDLITGSAESEVMASIEKVELLKKLHECPEPMREILYLRIFGNLSFKEIGEVFGKSENWARVTFYRSKEKLRKEVLDND